MVLSFQRAFVALGANNWQVVVEFYQQLLGQKPQSLVPNIYAEFSLQGLQLGIFYPKDAEEFNNSKAASLSLCLEVDNLEKAIAVLTKLGYPPPGKIAIASHGREIYATDPAGSRLILHEAIPQTRMRPRRILFNLFKIIII
jgi:predicted enzyme related to lactoylglutathione lyase